MGFFAGILVAWSAIYLLTVVYMLIVRNEFGSNKDYLFFAGVCFFGCVWALGRCAFYLADNLEQIVIPGRIVTTMLPLTASLFLSMALKRLVIRSDIKKGLFTIIVLVALVIAVLSMAGYFSDYSRPIVRTASFLSIKQTMFEYDLSSFGYFSVIYCISCAVVAGLILALTSQQDKLVRNFYIAGVVVMCGACFSDVLVISGKFNFVYLFEHGFFFMYFCLAVGFAREFERYRQKLQKSEWALEREIARADRAMSETKRLKPMADLGKLSASLAHEIRNPLAVLSNVASTLKRHGAGNLSADELETMVDMLMDETIRLAKLVDDLLLFSKTGRNTRISIGLDSLLEVVQLEATTLVPKNKDIQIERTAEPDLPLLDGSLNDLKRAMLNLVENSILTYNGPGKVKLIAKRDLIDKNTVLVGVEDEAGGVDDNSVNEIFEPFFSTRRTGTGLGLSIAKRITEAHNGHLRLDNRPGKGATFWIYLPVKGK